ncbi:two-component response regulator 24-like [Vicia villosa]|uniref:two-component response regulator 24-like n=1 Tax=Vicia villosa TaxID=3911 RepID=UPI00273C7BB4|nr:two-component response regulator 24-like [Vicia villosa]
MVSISDHKGKQIMLSDSEDSEDDDLSPSPHRKIIRALVVHHDDHIGKVNEVMLNRLGVETRSVKTSQEAIKLICVEEVYDLILLGRYLPVIDGVQMTKMLRDMEYPTTIVGVTRFLTEVQREEFFSAGLDGCIDNEAPLTDKTLACIVESIPRRQTWKKRNFYSTIYKSFRPPSVPFGPGSTSTSRDVSKKD